jgi:hypothetical protein
MLRSLTCIALALATALTVAGPAESGSRKYAPTASTPIKDCTRFNGNWGYYGNPWCTKAEQVLWDRAEARRVGR